jgi:hypothetical protein
MNDFLIESRFAAMFFILSVVPERGFPSPAQNIDGDPREDIHLV